MGKSFFVGGLLLATFFGTPERGTDPLRPLPPLPPNTANAGAPDAPIHDVEAIATQIETTLHPEVLYPTRVVIPSINVDSPVEHMGINTLGEMEVPDGNTTRVGWYKYGTVPGNTGSAVMDAHVYAAFKKLKNVTVGSDIYVVNEKGVTLHFRVISSKVYPLSQVPMDVIFSDASGKYLNLITCAGRYLPSRGTYEKRLVVYAELVE